MIPKEPNSDKKHEKDSSTTYFGTMVHLFKGNIGTGLFAMGEAYKNAGLVVGLIATVLIGAIALHCQVLLVANSKKMKEKYDLKECPSYAETMELCIKNGPLVLRKWSMFMRRSVNVYTILLQLGACCVYIVFVSDSLKQVVDSQGFYMDSRIYMAIIFLPIWSTCMLKNLKLLVPVLMFASIFMIIGIVMVLYYICSDLPPITTRNPVAPWQHFPFFFATAVFAFEAITMVIPLRNAMKKPEQFDGVWGVLKVATVIVIMMYTLVGFLGFWRYGDEVKGSLSLNLPQHEIFSLIVKTVIAAGILLGYCLQFHVGFEIAWPGIMPLFKFQDKLSRKLIVRTALVCLTFVVAVSIPNLVNLISLVGAVASSFLVLLFPPLIDLVVHLCDDKYKPLLIVKNILILLLAIVGFGTGTYSSIVAIVKSHQE